MGEELTFAYQVFVEIQQNGKDILLVRHPSLYPKPKKERLTLLEKEFGFHCQCCRCIE